MEVEHWVKKDVRGFDIHALRHIGKAVWEFNLRSHGDHEDIIEKLSGRFSIGRGEQGIFVMETLEGAKLFEVEFPNVISAYIQTNI